MNWYYSDSGAQKGPVDEATLAALVRQGVVTPDTLVWHDGMPDWQPLSAAAPHLAPQVVPPRMPGGGEPADDSGNPFHWFGKCFSKYCTFAGRARRKEYWMFQLANWILSFAVGAVDGMVGGGALAGLYSLAVVLPGLAVSVRRMHDLDKSGMMVCLPLVGLIGLPLCAIDETLGLVVLAIGVLAGGLWVFVLNCTEGTRGPNRFGPDPKGRA